MLSSIVGAAARQRELLKANHSLIHLDRSLIDRYWQPQSANPQIPIANFNDRLIPFDIRMSSLQQVGGSQ
jgi:hypothetical protein